MVKTVEPEKCPECGNPSWITGKKGAICTKCGYIKPGSSPVVGRTESK
jgi:hypothetical protein